MKLETSNYVVDYSNEENQGIDIINKATGIKVGVYVNNRSDVCIDVKDKDDKYILYQELNSVRK